MRPYTPPFGKFGTISGTQRWGLDRDGDIALREEGNKVVEQTSWMAFVLLPFFTLVLETLLRRLLKDGRTGLREPESYNLNLFL